MMRQITFSVLAAYIKRLVPLFLTILLLSCKAGGGGSPGSTTNSNGGSGGGQGSGSSSITAADAVFTGGDNFSSDSNLVVVPFSNSTTALAGATPAAKGIQPIATAASLQPGRGVTASLKKALWLSQHTKDCNDHTNGYCGYASILMGAADLGASTPANNIVPSLTTLLEQGGEQSWAYGPVSATTPQTPSWRDQVGSLIENSIPTGMKNECGGNGILWSNIPSFARHLGIRAKKFRFGLTGSREQERKWITAALENNQPILVAVHYQGSHARYASGQGTDQTEAEFYNGGDTSPKKMEKECVKKGAPPLVGDACDSTAGYSPLGHWVIVSKIDSTSVDSGYVLVDDPDPFAGNQAAGVRKYDLSSFLSVINDVRAGGRHPPDSLMYRLCSRDRPGCGPTLPAFTASVNSISIKAGWRYTGNSTLPVVVPSVPGATFSGTGLPSGLSMDTGGRILGQTSESGSYGVIVTMWSAVKGVMRHATGVINLVVKPADQIKEDLEFVAPEVLIQATAGTFYREPIGVIGSAETPALKLANGRLPPGLKLANGQITGIPTLDPLTKAKSYSFSIEASDSTSSVTKNFTINVVPASASTPLAVSPTLTAVKPASVIGMDGQQPVTFLGVDFIAGSLIQLQDDTNGGTYLKVPVSINPSGMQMTISADFTTSPATWSAQIIGPTGRKSATFMFSVVAPTGVAPVISFISPGSLTTSVSAQTIKINGSNFRLGAEVEITNLAIDATSSVKPTTRTARQLTVSFSFDSASEWAIRVLNADGTSSENMRVPVHAPPIVVAPASPANPYPGVNSVSETDELPEANAALDWSSVPSATYYAVAVRDLGNNALVVDTTTVSTSYSLNLMGGEQYSWNVAACNAAGCSPYTLPLYFHAPGTTVTAPQTPSGLSPGLVSGSLVLDSTTVNLRWGASSGATDYKLGVRDLATGTLVVSTTVTGTSYTANLNLGKQYRWNVAACNTAGCSAFALHLYFQTPTMLTLGSGSAAGGGSTTTCTTSFNTSSESIDSSGGKRQVILATHNPLCTWSAVSNQAWVHNITPLNGTAGATLTYTVDKNNSTQSRSATIMAGQAALTVSQLGTSASCTFSLGYTTQSVLANGGTFLEGLLASNQNCARTAQSNVMFITNVSPASGNGDANVSYTVAPNAAASPRSGTLTIAGQTLTQWR